MCCICSAEVAPKHSTALFSLVELKEDLSVCLSQILLVLVAESDGLSPIIAAIAERKQNPSRTSCTNSENLAKTASASSTYEASVPRTPLV